MCVGRTNGRSAAADVLDFFFVILRITYLHQGKKYGKHPWIKKRKELKNILYGFEKRRNTTTTEQYLFPQLLPHNISRKVNFFFSIKNMAGETNTIEPLLMSSTNAQFMFII